jgi:hypothetical protein
LGVFGAFGVFGGFTVDDVSGAGVLVWRSSAASFATADAGADGADAGADGAAVGVLSAVSVRSVRASSSANTAATMPMGGCSLAPICFTRPLCARAFASAAV